MLDARMARELDRHITGNWGEDQFRQQEWEGINSDPDTYLMWETGEVWEWVGGMVPPRDMVGRILEHAWGMQECPIPAE